jgi:hypothetical protein
MFSNWKFDGELESGLKPKGGQPEMGQKCFAAPNWGTSKGNLTQVLDVYSSVMTRLIGTGPSALESQTLGVPKSSKIFPKFQLFFLKGHF